MRKSFKLVVLAVLGLFVSSGMMAQMPSLPKDKNVRVGKLENGLTYYIRHNELPEHQAEFYIAQKVGSALEEDNQRGLAHFLEHMCFNGTKHFPGNGLIKYLESVGVKFGADLNAYTSIDETVYNISNVPTDRIGVQDSCLLILHDWSCALLLDGEEIDKERGVIHEEWRSRQNAMMRIYDKMLPKIYPDSKYAYRMPIGTMEVVDNFPYEALRSYYRKWYRPDQQGIIVVGDVDVDRIEAKIKEIFADATMPENPAERVYEPVADNEEAIYFVGSDKELHVVDASIMMKSDAVKPEQKDNQMYVVQSYVLEIISQMFDERLSEMSLSGDAPFESASTSVSSFMLSKTKDCFSIDARPKTGQEMAAVSAIMREALRVKRFGFTETEYQRAKDEYLSQLDKAYTNRDKMKNNQFVQTYVRNFIDNEPMMSMEDEYTFMSQIIQALPLQAINQLCAQLITVDVDKNLVVTYLAPEKDGGFIPAEADLKNAIESVRAENIEAYVDNAITEPLMSEIPAAGKILRESEDKTYGIRKYELSNGIRVITKKTDFKEDQIILSAYSKGGTSRANPSSYDDIALLPSAISTFGTGKFTVTDLNKLLSGKQAGVSVNFSRLYDTLSGNCVPKDLETMMQLMYLKFTSPLKDETTYKTVATRLRTNLENRHLNPVSALQDTLTAVLYGNHPLTKPMTVEMLDRANLDNMMAIYKDRLSDAGDFTFVIIGNFDEEKLRPMIETYIASLPATGRNEDFKDDGVDIVKGHKSNIFKNKMETPQSYMAVIQSGECEYTVENDINISVVSQVLTAIFLEKIREDAGATYSISTHGTLTVGVKPFWLLQTVCPVKPEQIDWCLETVKGALSDLAKNGIEAKYFDKAKEYLTKEYAKNQKENGFWLSVITNSERYGVDFTEDYKKALDALTAEKVVKFIKDVIIAQDNVIEVVMNPE